MLSTTILGGTMGGHPPKNVNTMTGALLKKKADQKRQNQPVIIKIEDGNDVAKVENGVERMRMVNKTGVGLY